MAKKLYTSKGIAVSFDGLRCIHAAECVRGLPEVFDTGKRPWIQPDRSDPEAITEVILRCPSGALQFERTDGIQETTPEENTIALVADGPIYVRGAIEISNTEGETLHRETRVALCRCGASANKPFCDNTHKEIGFRHDGSLGENHLYSKDDSTNGHVLGMVSITDGPLLLQGEIELRDSAEKISYRGSEAALCRCGASNNKPFCDGSHVRTGWREDL